jgi:glyoxylase-like metal-dependent hydrolase (beta-lactamase superfamily II)
MASHGQVPQAASTGGALRRARAAGVALAACWILAGDAGGQMVRTQAPGYYRMMLGDFEVTALNDGVIPYQTASVLPGLPPAEIERGLAAKGLTDPVGMSYNAYLINTGRKLILIDVGTGGKLQESPLFRGAGRLPANLRAAGYRPEQIDEIYLTHLGPDHVGGLTVDGKRAFPNAVIRAAQREVDRFLKPAPSFPKQIVQFWSDLFEPYRKAGKFETFDQDVTLVPGIRAMATTGHSEGHTSYVVESGGQALVVWGDLVLVGAIQFARPDLETAFDFDRKAAVTERERLMRLAVDRDAWVAGAHLSFPGIGHVRAGPTGYLWLPATYAITDLPR